ncbi:MAG: large-conductance mechanosensitive channel protein MscL [Anaerolineales bacterium]
MWKEFKEFAMQGNMIDLAVGIIIGAAFSGVVNSLVNDVIMPPIGLLLGGADFADLFLLLKEGATAGPYLTLAAARDAGAVTLNYGMFLNTLINFLVVAWSIFLVIRVMNRFRKEEAEAEAAE